MKCYHVLIQYKISCYIDNHSSYLRKTYKIFVRVSPLYSNFHFILPRRKFFKVQYLQRMKETRKGVDYKLVEGEILIHPVEIMVPFVELTELPGDFFFLRHDECISILEQFRA